MIHETNKKCDWLLLVVLFVRLGATTPRVAGFDTVFASYDDASGSGSSTTSAVRDTPYAMLDLDYRSILAQTSKGTAAGLDQAKTLYKQGKRSGSGGSSGTNAITLQSIRPSTTSTTSSSSSSTLTAFSNFYGQDDYAEQYIQAALDPTVASLTLGGDDDNEQSQQSKQVLNFAPTPSLLEGRVRTVQTSVLLLNVWMAVAEALHQATTVLCAAPPTTATPAALALWDQAVSLYTGSLAESNEPLGGYFLYRLAQEQAEVFGTTPIGQEAPINQELMRLFVEGKALLQQADCSSTVNTAVTTTELQIKVDRMMALLRVPVLQASLRIMYAFDEEGERRPVLQGEAAALGVAAAGIVSECSPGVAQSVLRDMNYGNQVGGSFSVIQGAFERHYECLGIACADVGGIITLQGNTYVDRGEACGNVRPVDGAGYGSGSGGSGSETTTPNTSPTTLNNGEDDRTQAAVLILAVVLPLLMVVVLALALCHCRNRRQRRTAERAVGATSIQKETATGDLVLNEGPEGDV